MPGTGENAPERELEGAAFERDGRKVRRVYGRRAGPRVKTSQRALLEGRLPSLSFEVPDDGSRIDPRALFGRAPERLWLEVGFGGGEHLASLAERHPDVAFVGVEPFLSGVVKLLKALEGADAGNVKVCTDDARLVIDALPDGCLERAYVLYPDPWPKARHHKRRIVNARSAKALARLVRPGGELRLATDDVDYARWMLEAVSAVPAWRWLARDQRDWREPWEGWVRTRYEAKALKEGRRPFYFRFAKR